MTLTSVNATSVALNEPLLLALARARAAGRSAYQIAAEASVHPSELSRWVNGRRIPTRTQAERVAVSLGYSVDALFAQTRHPEDFIEVEGGHRA